MGQSTSSLSKLLRPADVSLCSAGEITCALPTHTITCRYSGLTFAKNLVMVLTGILTGAICFLINRTVESFVDWRNERMAEMIDKHAGFFPAFGVNLTYGVTLIGTSACMVRPFPCCTTQATVQQSAGHSHPRPVLHCHR